MLHSGLAPDSFSKKMAQLNSLEQAAYAKKDIARKTTGVPYKGKEDFTIKQKSLDISLLREP